MTPLDLHAAAADLEAIASLAPATAVERLAAIRAALATSNDPAALEALGRSIPRRVSTLSPEVGLAMVELASALAPYRPRIPADASELEPRLAIAWARARIAAGDAASAGAMADELLLRVVTGWSIDAIDAPLPLLLRLGRAADPRLRAVALAWTPLGVQHLALTPSDAFACIEPLAADADAAIRRDALRSLGQLWLAGIPPAAKRRREQIIRAALGGAPEPATRDSAAPRADGDPRPAAPARDDPEVVRAAIDAAAALGARDWLVDLVADGSGAAGAGAAYAIEALGRLAQPDDVDLVLASVDEDPLRFAPAARVFLLEAHRHGVFVRERHVPKVLAGFDAHRAWTGEEIVRVTHVVRADLVRHMAELPVDDRRWIRRAAILAASVGAGAHVLIADLLDRAASVDVAIALVGAAGRSSEYEGEDRLLRWLDRAEEAVVPVLRVKGGPNAIERLRAIALDRFTPRALRASAIDALWALEADRGALLADLARHVGPHESGLLDGRRAARRDETPARVLREAAWEPAPHHAVDPLVELQTYAESGEIRYLPDVTRLFRDVFRRYVRLALEGDFSIKRLQMPELEQVLFRYGRHLVKDGRSVRRWIEDGPETGRDLVLLTIVDWLRESPSSAVAVALLEAAARHAPSGATLRAIEPFWRRGEPNVRRAAIEAILAAGDGARGLELSLCRLVEDASDPRILTQALAAARTLRASWAEPLVRAALRRPEMGVKKEAAEALSEIGDGRSVPALVRWLASHDNESFRASLLKALESAAGPAAVAVLVDALDAEVEGEDDARRRELLERALSGHLALAPVLRLARSPRRAHRALVTACLEGRVRVDGATAEELAAHLHRARLRATSPGDDPTRRLRVEGFSKEAAAALVLSRAPDVEARVVATVRAALADWVSWIAEDAAAGGDAIALVLDAADKGHAEQIDRLLDVLERRGAPPARARDGAAPRSAAAQEFDPAAAAAFLERCVAAGAASPAQRVRAIGVLRALPPSPRFGGLRRYRLLGRLGAVRGPSDLAACLAESRVGPSVASDSAALLIEALSIPAARDDEPEAITATRDAARDWYREDVRRRDAWLASVLAARPLDVAAPPPPRAPSKPRFTPRSTRDLDALVATLRDGDAPERQRAAARILGWPDAASAWPRVLDAFFARRIELDRDALGRLAATVTSWPEGDAERARAVALVPMLSPRQLRALVPAWLDAWEQGDPRAGEALGAVDPERLLPHVAERARRGSYAAARLLKPGSSTALRALVDLVRAAAPREVSHLTERANEAAEASTSDDPVDPIAGKDVDRLVGVVTARGVEKGLAVRAVHAMTAHGDGAIAPLARLVVDRRPEVRSAALRALRAVASREQTLEAAAEALKMETRRDVVIQLMSSLGHGRYPPALPILIERLTDGDPRIRKGAHAALRAWGRDAVPALRHAARRARPDRRPHYAAVITDLE